MQVFFKSADRRVLGDRLEFGKSRVNHFGTVKVLRRYNSKADRFFVLNPNTTLYVSMLRYNFLIADANVYASSRRFQRLSRCIYT